MYPAFNLFGVGTTDVLLSNFYSSTLGNIRDISVYTPYTLIENPIKRKVNIVVVYDGDIQTMTLLASSGGIDTMVTVGQLPEAVFIGMLLLNYSCQ
jgi:enterochelin esterase-like enzyme